MGKEGKDGKIVFVYVEGDQATLQQALQQVGTVVNRGMNPQPKTIIAVPVNHKVLTADKPENGGVSGKEFYEVPKESEEVEVDNVTVSPPSSKAKGPKRAQKVPELLPDDELTSDQVSFPDFATKMNTSTQFAKYLAVAAWFKRYKNAPEITVRHIYSCYQLMKWQAPDNLSVAFSDMKRLHNYFGKGQAPGSWAITLVGSNEVDNLNRSAA